MDLEAEDARHVPFQTLCRYQRRVDLEDDVVEGGAKVGSVDGGVAARLRVVHVLAAGAVELDGFNVGDVRQAHGEERVVKAVDAGAFAKLGFLIFFKLRCMLAWRITERQ